MTKEEKQLLLVDLCGRLPYHPIVYVDENLPRLKLGASTRVWEYVAVDKPCKPYLRPMSSMTEEEEGELKKIHHQFYKGNFNDAGVFSADDCGCTVFEMASIINYLRSRNFDYCGMIDKGLALEALKGMYGKEAWK